MIPFNGISRQYNTIRSEILDVTDQVLRSGILMSGNYTTEFENWLAKKNSVSYAVTCHSGTQALEIIAGYYKLKKDAQQEKANHGFVEWPNTNNNSCVLMPSLTFPATANAFLSSGWKVQFVDTDTYGVFDAKHIPDSVEYDTVVLVGLYGAALKELWRRKSNTEDVVLIEDGAQHWLSNNCKRIGDCAISFDPTKNFANHGNGGAVLTNKYGLYNYATSWRTHGKPLHQGLGSNSRMSEIDCAQLMVKTKYLDGWQKRRKEIADFWVNCFKVPGIRTLIDHSNQSTHSYHKFVIDVDMRDELQKKLADKKIETKIHYEKPLNEIGIFKQCPGPDMLSNGSILARRVLSLPCFPELTDLEVEYLADQVLLCRAA